MFNKGTDYTGIAVVFFCHDGHGNFLMAKRSQNARDEHGKWDIGGGGIDLHDDVIEKMKSEIKEEYCTEVVDYEFLGYRDVHRENSDSSRTHWIALDYKVRVKRELAKIGEPHKFDSIGWFRLRSLPQELHSALPGFLEKYKARLKPRNEMKLIRDKVSEHLKAQGVAHRTRRLSDAEFRAELKEKMREESEEFFETDPETPDALKNPMSLRELADLQEVIDAWAPILGATPQELRQIQEQKRAEKGGFSERTFLEECE